MGRDRARLTDPWFATTGLRIATWDGPRPGRRGLRAAMDKARAVAALIQIGLIALGFDGAMASMVVSAAGKTAILAGLFDGLRLGAVARLLGAAGLVFGVISKIQEAINGINKNPPIDPATNKPSTKAGSAGGGSLWQTFLNRLGGVFGAEGGLFTGPTSGYAATLHGTEAVLPKYKASPALWQTVSNAINGGGSGRALSFAGAGAGSGDTTTNYHFQLPSGTGFSPQQYAQAVSREQAWLAKTK